MKIVPHGDDPHVGLQTGSHGRRAIDHERRIPVNRPTGTSLLMATVLALGSTPAFGQEKASSDAKDKDYARMPWHLVDVWWDLGRDMPFQSYSIDVTISDD